MISPDAGNMGVKAIYVWAGMLVPTVAILYIYYPEVSACSPLFPMSKSFPCSSRFSYIKTAGRTYWELDELYERRIPPRKFKNTPTLADQTGHKNKAFVPKLH